MAGMLVKTKNNWPHKLAALKYQKAGGPKMGQKKGRKEVRTIDSINCQIKREEFHPQKEGKEASKGSKGNEWECYDNVRNQKIINDEGNIKAKRRL